VKTATNINTQSGTSRRKFGHYRHAALMLATYYPTPEWTRPVQSQWHEPYCRIPCERRENTGLKLILIDGFLFGSLRKNVYY